MVLVRPREADRSRRGEGKTFVLRKIAWGNDVASAFPRCIAWCLVVDTLKGASLRLCYFKPRVSSANKGIPGGGRRISRTHVASTCW